MNIDDRGCFQRQWAKLSERQKRALVEANQFDSAETETTVIDDPDNPGLASGDDVSTSTHTSSSREVYVITTIKNVFGQTLAKFRHEVYWEYNFTEITYINPKSEGTTSWPFWSYAGLSSNSKQVRGCQGESTRVGKFNYSVTEFGQLQQKNIGSEINVQCDGAWTYRRIS